MATSASITVAAGSLYRAGIASAADAAPYAIPANPNDNLVVSVMFTLVVGLLTTVTLGVAYLALRSFLDKQQETQDRETGLKVIRPASAKKAEEKEEELILVKRPGKVKREKKGFANFED